MADPLASPLLRFQNTVAVPSARAPVAVPRDVAAFQASVDAYCRKLWTRTEPTFDEFKEYVYDELRRMTCKMVTGKACTLRGERMELCAYLRQSLRNMARHFAARGKAYARRDDVLERAATSPLEACHDVGVGPDPSQHAELGETQQLAEGALDEVLSVYSRGEQTLFRIAQLVDQGDRAATVLREQLPLADRTVMTDLFRQVRQRALIWYLFHHGGFDAQDRFTQVARQAHVREATVRATVRTVQRKLDAARSRR